MTLCDLCGKVAECIRKEIAGRELNVCEDCPVMNFTEEQIQIASLIDSKVQTLTAAGCDDATIMSEMLGYSMVEFERLWNTSQRGEIDELCRRLPWFYRYARIENLACST
jgi:hypothetical protein